MPAGGDAFVRAEDHAVEGVADAGDDGTDEDGGDDLAGDGILADAAAGGVEGGAEEADGLSGVEAFLNPRSAFLAGLETPGGEEGEAEADFEREAAGDFPTILDEEFGGVVLASAEVAFGRFRVRAEVTEGGVGESVAGVSGVVGIGGEIVAAGEAVGGDAFVGEVEFVVAAGFDGVLAAGPGEVIGDGPAGVAGVDGPAVVVADVGSTDDTAEGEDG